MHTLRRVTNSQTVNRAITGVCCGVRRGYFIKKFPKTPEEEDDDSSWPKKIFSGIQPTGSLHLGNYLGAVQKWTDLQNEKQDVTYCIVDMHSITLPQDPQILRENIFQMAATMLACGINPHKSTLFVQSSVKEHSELAWILNCLSTMARLGHLPQYKEKTKTMKELPLGLFVYPVLQAADIMLYKTTHVPVGEDQIQHIQLTQHLTRTFNAKYGRTFPICHAVIDNKHAARIRSLRDPAKKMSKSDPDSRATINIIDSPDEITEKFKKAITDFNSDVTYDPANRPGVSNLVVIHSLMSGKSIEQIVNEASSLETAKYKLLVADVVIEHLKPLRTRINELLLKPDELVYLLEIGAEKAREHAAQTMCEVKQKVGLGAIHIPGSFHDVCDMKAELSREKKIKEKAAAAAAAAAAVQPISSDSSYDADWPLVPNQAIRREKLVSTKNYAPKLKMELRPLPNIKKNIAFSNTDVGLISASSSKPSSNVIYTSKKEASSLTPVKIKTIAIGPSSTSATVADSTAATASPAPTTNTEVTTGSAAPSASTNSNCTSQDVPKESPKV